MQLYGTTTSPYVRRVRVVATEVGEPVELIDTQDPAVLRAATPIRKVPVATIDGKTLFDSRAITAYLTVTRGWGELERGRDDWHELNLVNAVDAALDSVIQLFYLRRDGIAIDDTPFAARQLERTEAIFGWLATQLGPARGFGLAELALVTALDWMDFRKSYPTERAAALEPVRMRWRERPSLVATRPHA